MVRGTLGVPGGKALEFYPSVWIKMYKIDFKQGEEYTGQKVFVKITKNKVGAPNKELELNFFYDKGYDATADLVDLAIARGILRKEGRRWFLGKTLLGMGLPRVRAFLEANPETKEEIIKLLK